MWDGTVAEEITEEFDSLTGGSEDRCRPYEDFSPRLSDEIDMQEWHKHILLSRPMTDGSRGVPMTCVRVSERKWKNGSGEGKWYSVSESNSWGEQDYAVMSVTPCGVDIWAQPGPEKPKRIVAEEPEPAIETLPVEPTKRVRIQVTKRAGGEYVAGDNGNFQVSGASGARVTEILRPLEVSWPRVVKPACSVRVQIQNLIDGAMSGGGNYQLHNADVPAVLAEIGRLVTEAGLTVEKRGGKVAAESVASARAKPEPVSRVWEEWKDAKDVCPGCGCGEKGKCLCRLLGHA